MTSFSRILAEYIKENDISVAALARYTGIERTYLYRIINGSRTPGEKSTVEKISDFLHMTPIMKENFIEEWKKVSMGEEKYFQFKRVYDFLENFPFFDAKQNHSVSLMDIPAENMETDRIILSATEIMPYLIKMIREESGKGSAHLNMIVPPDEKIVLALSYIDDSVTMEIDHIFALDSGNNKRSTDYNLYCLQNIIVLYTYSYNYRAYYYYNDSMSWKGLLDIFPFMILSSERAMLLSKDLSTALAISDREIIEELDDRFREYKGRVRLFANKVTDTFKYLETLNKDLKKEEGGSYAFQMVPCITHFLTPELLQKYITVPEEIAEKLISAIGSYAVALNENHEDVTYIEYFSEEGVKEFLRSGRIPEYPSEIYRTVEPEDRRALIYNLINNTTQNVSQVQICV